MIFLGIDPGASGGLAALDEANCLRFTTMPDTEQGVYEWVDRWESYKTVAVIEKVGGHIGGPGQPGSSMFVFGWGYGGLRMALTACGIEFTAVPPQTWQKAVGMKSGGRSCGRAPWKNLLKRRAEELFPDLKITLATADALLLAWYCRSIHTETTDAKKTG